MDAITRDMGHLSWLFATLSSQRDRLTGLLQRLSGLGMPGALKASIFRKFLNMLDQISVAKEKEFSILSQIETIEAKHRFHKKGKNLRYISSEKREEKMFDPDINSDAENDPSSGKMWWMLLAFMALSSGGKIGQKKQALTAN